jgi:hypothetical protein
MAEMSFAEHDNMVSHTIERGKYKAVNVAEGHSPRGFAPQHV